MPGPTDPPDVRVTFSLPLSDHQRLHARLHEMAEDIGVPRVAAADVLRGLLDAFHADPGLRARVTASIAHRRAVSS